MATGARARSTAEKPTGEGPDERSGQGSGAGSGEGSEPLNEVALRGRLAAAAEERELPSGDTIVTLRVVVPRRGGPTRPRPADGVTRRPGVDTIDVVCWSAGTRRAALRLRADEQVEVSGALRRRFFGGRTGPQSRYEVEAASVRRAGRRRPPSK